MIILGHIFSHFAGETNLGNSFARIKFGPGMISTGDFTAWKWYGFPILHDCSPALFSKVPGVQQTENGISYDFYQENIAFGGWKNTIRKNIKLFEIG